MATLNGTACWAFISVDVVRIVIGGLARLNPPPPGRGHSARVVLSRGPLGELTSAAVALWQQAHPAGGRVQVAAQVLTGECLVDLDVVYLQPVLPVAPGRGCQARHAGSRSHVHVSSSCV
jgi:hypothetical protein